MTSLKNSSDATLENAPQPPSEISQFTHLHVHSQYSILDATASIPRIIQKTKSCNMESVALTDHGNLYGCVEFYKAAKEAKIKPIIGCELYIAPESRFDKKKSSHQPIATHLTLLAKNYQGYKNLCKLSSIGFLEGFYYVPRIDWPLLEQYREGLICLSGCLKGPLAQQILYGSQISYEQELNRLFAIFKDDLYLELQRLTSSIDDIQMDGFSEESWLMQQYEKFKQQQETVEAVLKKAGLPLVATNNCHYLERDEWRAHEVLLNIQSGEPVRRSNKNPYTGAISSTSNPKRDTFPSHEFYFKSKEEMIALFSDLPEAINNSQKIVEKCNLELDFKAKHYPVFYPPGYEKGSEDRSQAAADYLQKLCEDGIKKRYTPARLAKVQEKYPDQDPMDVVRKRLQYEMSIITSKGMCDYLLIVWDFINWAKQNGIPMGPGRGSGAGAIICYLIGITDIEPLRFNLFFERFINPERLSYPDIDVDMCMERRSDVINYTIQKYGKEQVAQIITFGSMKAKMAVKDVGRALDIPLAKVNQIAKLIPEELSITIEKALEVDPDLRELYAVEEETKELLDLAKTLEGCIRNTGIHAAGMIIAEQPLIELIPICLAKDSSMLATQYSMKPVESIGMLKIDFLGLKTLTSIQIAVNAIKKRYGIEVNWIDLPLDDQKTFDLLNQGKTLGVFQLESGGMQELSKQLHLDKFEEIIAVLSLYRPGPMDMIPSFIARKHGLEPIEYDHPWMAEILQETYGIMVYQEQVMQIAQKLANYSLGEGDVLRRAMGKKDTKEMARQREKFIQGAARNSIDLDTATLIFDKMEKFAEYGFNKSHAAAYGYVTYVTAYLKANYPDIWLSALMTCDKDDIEKVAKFMHEGTALGVPILPPDINESSIDFTATDGGIRFALGAIKGVGEAVVEAILHERAIRGPFTCLYDCISRVDLKKIGKKSFELLIDAGCFDCFGWQRDESKSSLEAMFDQAQKKLKEKECGILQLFNEETFNKTPFSSPPKVTKVRSEVELLFREKELLGLFLTGHPLRAYSRVLSTIGARPLKEIDDLPGDSVFRAAFIAEEVQIKISSKSQKKFAIVKASDTSGAIIEIPFWPESFEAHALKLVPNALLWAVLSKETKPDGTQIQCRWLGNLQTFTKQDLEESDVAFDKAKSLLSFRAKLQKNSKSHEENKSRDSKQEKTPPSSSSSKSPKKHSLQLDLAYLRASHLLFIKELLKPLHKSTTSQKEILEIAFMLDGQERARLTLSQFQITQEIRKELKKIPSFITISTT